MILNLFLFLKFYFLILFNLAWMENFRQRNRKINLKISPHDLARNPNNGLENFVKFSQIQERKLVVQKSSLAFKFSFWIQTCKYDKSIQQHSRSMIIIFKSTKSKNIWYSSFNKSHSLKFPKCQCASSFKRIKNSF